MELNGAKLALSVTVTGIIITRVNFNSDKVDGYGKNLDNHDAMEGVGHGGIEMRKLRYWIRDGHGLQHQHEHGALQTQFSAAF
ncbi:hypothetical protein Goshw_008467 [Gossypium schwendimanii]|uniref:Uncharacterized protein n=1 Tax=Gossypium schwendimanii TaxID=34291 RepID=A0A7J9MMJ6_GOSSC|nr:hypothetical protein [Gossypium schwendimanii]